MANDLQATIESAYELRAQITPQNVSHEVRAAVEEVLGLLDKGSLRVAEKRAGQWHVNEWLKKAVLLSFRISQNTPIRAEGLNFYDKVPLKYSGWDAEQFAAAGVRVVPPATVRRGAFVASNVVLMPSYVNIGAYVDSGTMVDTWATVGSCAQIGKNVHLSGGVGIGGVLEPLQASPTIIEDDCFIGARSEIVERARWSPWAYSSGKVPVFTIASAMKFCTGACPPAPSLFRERYRLRTANMGSRAP